MNHGLLLLWIFIVLVGMHVSTQKLTYDVTVSVNSSRVVAAALNTSHTVLSKQPLSVSMAAQQRGVVRSAQRSPWEGPKSISDGEVAVVEDVVASARTGNLLEVVGKLR